jgi:hypothetical protein
MIRNTLAVLSTSVIIIAGCARVDTPTGSSESGVRVPLAAGQPGTVSANTRGGRPASTGVVYVTSQGLYYDTFVARDPLPMAGRFQLISNGQTEFGPGDPGYLGGRWWEDVNGDGAQDAGDHFFLCPLLPPGRPTP